MISLSLDSPELAERYDVAGQRQFEHGKLLVQDLDVRPGHRVLDLGCGTGLLGAWVAEAVGREGKVIGIDPLPLRVDLARRRAGPSFEARVGRAEELTSFPDASFDVVYLNSVIHWLPDPLAVLKEIRRVLKPGGRVGFTTMARERPHSSQVALRRALEATGLADRPGADVGAPSRLSREQAGAIFRDAGLRETQAVIRTFTDHFTDADEVLAFTQASSFGNHLSGLDDEERRRVRDAFARELEPSRTTRGLEQQRHLVFAVAEREREDCARGSGAPGCERPLSQGHRSRS